MDSGTPYHELIGSLNYIAVATRPDIAYAVGRPASFLDCRRPEHWSALYEFSSISRGLKTSPESLEEATRSGYSVTQTLIMPTARIPVGPSVDTASLSVWHDLLELTKTPHCCQFDLLC